MRFSISNIGWNTELDGLVYSLMKKNGFTGLEVAPTRIFPENPYGKLEQAKQWSLQLKKQFGFSVSSMQSIWYGRSENIFSSDADRQALMDYTKKAIDFAESIGCNNLVFGCPKNRAIPEKMSGSDVDSIAVTFFKELGNYAFSHGRVLAIEANPPIYNTNYINDTDAAIELVRKVDSKGFLLNLDVGTMVQNGESVHKLKENLTLINHVHISEPGLNPIQKRTLHIELMNLLKINKYTGFVSIEMGKQDNIASLSDAILYVKEFAE